MPKVKFLRDFQGRATREVFYKQGAEVELPDAAAEAVVVEGVAEFVADVSKPGGAVEVVTYEEVEPVVEDPKPAKKRGKK